MFEAFKKKLNSFFGKSEKAEEKIEEKPQIKEEKIDEIIEKPKVEEKPKKSKEKKPSVKKTPKKDKELEEPEIKIAKIPVSEKLPDIEKPSIEPVAQPPHETPTETIVKESTIKEEKKKFSLWPFSKKKSEDKEAKKEEEIKEKVHEIVEQVETELEEKEELSDKSAYEPSPSTTIVDKITTSDETPSETGFFSKFMKKLSPTTTTLEKKHVEEIFSELEMTLLENNVALEVVDKIHSNLEKDLVGIEVKRGKIEETILSSLKSSILEVLIEPPNLIEQIKNKKDSPFVILFFGINGSGKTTSIAKLASFLQSHNIKCVLAAGDTFRAASIEQLEKHAHNLKVPIIKHQYGSDPAAVAFDAIKYAESNKIPVVLIDTAGRMYTKSNLLKEMEKIIRIAKPDLKIFVGESITGNDAVDQARTFNESAGIDGIILSKADIDEKAGTVLSVSYVTNKPIYFLGFGQKYSDLKPFTKSEVLKNIGLN